MTREEHISNLETIGCDGWTVTTDAYKSLQFAIEALEQEPFINKPCVAQGSCEHDKNEVLDKIREEIRHFMMEVNPSSSESDYACNYIFGILDKYKSESEDEE